MHAIGVHAFARVCVCVCVCVCVRAHVCVCMCMHTLVHARPIPFINEKSMLLKLSKHTTGLHIS